MANTYGGKKKSRLLCVYHTSQEPNTSGSLINGWSELFSISNKQRSLLIKCGYSEVNKSLKKDDIKNGVILINPV